MEEKIRNLIDGYRRSEKRLRENAQRMEDRGLDATPLLSASELYDVVISDLERVLK